MTNKTEYYITSYFQGTRVYLHQVDGKYFWYFSKIDGLVLFDSFDEKTKNELVYEMSATNRLLDVVEKDIECHAVEDNSMYPQYFCTVYINTIAE